MNSVSLVAAIATVTYQPVKPAVRKPTLVLATGYWLGTQEHNTALLIYKVLLMWDYQGKLETYYDQFKPITLHFIC